MSQLSRGSTFSDTTPPDNEVNAARLNGLVDNATLLPGAITEQPIAIDKNDTDYLLLYQDGALKRITVEHLLSSIDSTPGNSPVGAIFAWPTNTAPANHKFCNGQAVSRATYDDLFTLLGTSYGAGDASTTFNLPDLRGRVVAGLDNMGGGAANRLQVSLSGTLPSSGNTITVTTTNLAVGMYVRGTGIPANTVITSINSPSQITISRNTTTGGSQSLWFSTVTDATALGGNGGSITHKLSEDENAPHTHTVDGASDGHDVATGSGDTASDQTTQTTSSSGLGQAHNNTQPTYLLNWIIRVLP